MTALNSVLSYDIESYGDGIARASFIIGMFGYSKKCTSNGSMNKLFDFNETFNYSTYPLDDREDARLGGAQKKEHVYTK